METLPRVQDGRSFLHALSSMEETVIWTPSVVCMGIDDHGTGTTKVYPAYPKYYGEDGDCSKFPVPSDIVNTNAELKGQWVPKGVSFRHITYVYTSHINHPGDLFIQFDDGDVKDVYEKFEENLQDFYNSEDGTFYRMHRPHIHRGLICVGCFYGSNSWHRVKIQKVSRTFVEAYFVDYGTTENVLHEDLRYLRQKFYNLPAQAVKAQLANVKPRINNKWIYDEKLCVRRLGEWTFEQRLKTSIFGYSLSKDVLYVYLQNDTESLTVNELLIQNKLARFCNHAVEDSGIIVNPHWCGVIEQIGAEALREAVLKTSGSAATALSSSDDHVSVGGATGCGTNAKSSSLRAVPTNRKDVYCELFEHPTAMVWKEIMLNSDRNVKRLILESGITIHMIKFMNIPHVSCQEVAHIVVGSRDIDLLRKKGENKHVNRECMKLYKIHNEDLFKEIEKYQIPGVYSRWVKDKQTSVLLVLPLKGVMRYISKVATNPDIIIDDIHIQMMKPDVDDSQNR